MHYNVSVPDAQEMTSRVPKAVVAAAKELVDVKEPLPKSNPNKPQA